MNQSSPVLQAESISRSFPSSSGKDKLEILKHLSLTVTSSEMCAIVGPSGSGKSTLLHLLGGLDLPDSGKIYWNRFAISDWKPDKLADERNRQIGFIFQFHHLLPEFSALENVCMPALIGGRDIREAEPRATQLLERIGLSERMHHRPAQLSGGEQQRVSIARALMNKPAIILADEPTGNLDEKNSDAILDQLSELRDTEQVAMVLITHDRDIANRCDSVYELTHGALRQLKAD
ncbi:MAG: ABC transporter ATP-binding protein [Balneolaceae bacterium]